MIELISSLRCPRCDAVHQETMPVEPCQFFYQCRACGTLLRPEQGDCCVFCSFGSVSCPPRQRGDHC